MAFALSKYPYFNRAYVISSGFGCTHLYIYVSVMNNDVIDVFVVLAKSKDRALVKTAALVLKIKVLKLGLAM